FNPPAWETSAGIDDLAAIARRADELGYDFMCFPGHVAIPEEVGAVRGLVYWDPVATMSYIAAHTTRLKLCAYVVVLGYYHPLQIAKSYGSVDKLSGGRVILGVGVGSLEQEFELLGVPFADRGPRADDALKALRASLSQRTPEYHGEYYDYEGFVVEPHAVQDHVPIWVGGRTRRSLRRALELADGWSPFKLKLDELRPLLDAHRAAIDSKDGFDLIFPSDPPLDPLRDPDETDAVVTASRDAGATGLALRFVHSSREQYLEQLAAFAARHITN
ncbi:MAG: TIGR03619 family F420-dependent LLM class oxidoreductase, partial [Actinobacteria bacterium]|nr:TIGR03619 family F420-dependent LLM class oxidoreductase [Actinomycetota bacterium]